MSTSCSGCRSRMSATTRQRLGRRQEGGIPKRRAGNGIQKIDAGVHAEIGQGLGKLNTLLPRLAKAEDAAAAHPEPGGAGHAHGFQILLVGVGGTDRREMARGGFEIVMIGRKTRLAQPGRPRSGVSRPSEAHKPIFTSRPMRRADSHSASKSRSLGAVPLVTMPKRSTLLAASSSARRSSVSVS